MDYLIITGILVICLLVYLKLANNFKIIDLSGFKKNPSKTIFTGGGVLFYIAAICFFYSSNFLYPYFILGLSIIAVISFLDDLLHLSPSARLLFQFIAVGLLLFQVGVSNFPLIVILLILIIAVGFVNCYNFMDGINGILGFYSLVVLSCFLFINITEHIVSNDLIVYVMLSILIFGFYNFREKAILFSGDVGSISMAMIVLFLGLSFAIKLNAPVILLSVAVYGIDSGLTILYRIYLKENILKPHSYHIYQKLVDVLKWNHLKVAGVYALLQSFIGLVVLFTYKFSFLTQILITLGLVLVISLGYGYAFKKTAQKLKQ